MAIAFVQPTNIFENSASFTAPWASSNVAGNTLIYVVSWQFGGANVVTLTDGNSPTVLGSVLSTGFAQKVFVVQSCLGGANSAVVSIGAPQNFSSISMYEYSGVSGFGTPTTGSNPTGSTVIVTAGPITLSKNGSVVVAILSVGSNATVDPDTGAVLRGTGAGAPPQLEEYAPGTSGNVITPTMTDHSGGNAWNCFAVELIPSFATQFRTLMGVGV